MSNVCRFPLKSCYVALTHERQCFYPNVTTLLRSGLCYRKSVCLSSVTFVRPGQGLKLSAISLRLFVPWPSFDLRAKFYGDGPRGTPPSGALNARGVTKQSDVTFGYLIPWWVSCTISEVAAGWHEPVPYVTNNWTDGAACSHTTSSISRCGSVDGSMSTKSNVFKCMAWDIFQLIFN